MGLVDDLIDNYANEEYPDVGYMAAKSKRADLMRAELAALRARVAALEKAVEAGDALMLSIDTMVDVEFREDGERSGYEDDVVDAIAAYRAAREASRE